MVSPSEKWTWSDKLSVALACAGAALALVLFLVEKTPGTVAVMLACIAALLTYPILHFVTSRTARIPVFVATAGLVVLFGWKVWPRGPQPHPVAPSSATVITPQASKSEEPQDSGRLTIQPLPAQSPNRKPDHVSQQKVERARPIQQNASPTINLQPGAVASFGQQGGITAGQVIVAEESTLPRNLEILQDSVAPPRPNEFPFALQVSIKSSAKIDSPTFALFFDGPVELPTTGLPFACMFCGFWRLKDANGTSDLNTIWVFWKMSPLLPSTPFVYTFESLRPIRLIRVSKGPLGP